MAEQTMVERVMNAIGHNLNERCNPKEVARAAIEAMRIENVVYWVDGFPHASPKDVDWNERIDAALKP